MSTAALREAIAGDGEVPSVYACYRFAAKLRKFKPMLDACLDRVTASLHAEAAVSTDTDFTRRSAPARTSHWPGKSRRP